MTSHRPAADLDEAAVESLAESFRGDLVRPADPGYDDARGVWNDMVDRYPALVARCAGTADVMDAVSFAREQALPLAVRSGGHNVAGTCVCDDGVVVDLSWMRGVLVDPDERRVRVQGGATWGDVDRETQAFGLVVPGGVVSTTGVAGLTLGGGYGWTRRALGLSCDSLVAADVVTADGSLVRASEDEHEDLLWALRGGGGNVGVVTAFEFDCHELGPEVAFLGALYPIEAAEDVLGEWRSFVADAPPELTVDALFWTVPEHETFPEELHGTPFVGLMGMYAGPVEDGLDALQPMREVADPLLDLTGPHPYRGVQAMMDPFFPEGELRYYWKSHYLPALTDDAIEVVAEYARERPSPRSLVPLRSRGGAVTDVGLGATAFPDRSSPFMLSIDGTWTDPDDDEENVEWVREFWEAAEPYSAGRGYANFSMLEADEATGRDAFGENYDRLVAVKDEYDPENLFRRNPNAESTG